MAYMKHVAGAIKQLGLQPDDMQAHADKSAYMVSSLGTLLRKPGEITPRDVVNAASTAVANGIAQPSDAVKFLASLPDDPAQIRPYLQQHFNAAIAAAVQSHGLAQRAPIGAPPAPGAITATAAPAPASNGVA